LKKGGLRAAFFIALLSHDVYVDTDTELPV
jgi:hypothetical protein